MSHAQFAKPAWHLVDARGQVLGRLACQLVHILRVYYLTRMSFEINFLCYYSIFHVYRESISLLLVPTMTVETMW